MILSFPRLLLFLLVSLSATLAREGNTEDEQAVLRQLLKGPLAPECTKDRSSYFYRSIEGNCNWLLPGETHWGGAGEPLARDHLQYSYKDGIGEPRDGPSAREVSNAFFRRKKSLYYEHTSLLVGMVEFVIHDISTTSRSHAETIPIPVPRCDEFFDPECTGNKTLTMWRTAAVPGTGTNRTNPRESMNGGSTWLDLSPLYGITTEVARKLRAFQHGKLLTQTGPDGGEYLPFDTMGIPMNGWGKDPSELFAGGDSRVNQDWLLVGVHTLLLRNHNRFCDILRAQHPDWDDERLYQYARHANIAHYQVGLNLYQRAYFTPEMSPPAEDGFGLFRTWFGESSWTINPYHSYPWEKTLVRGKPLISSQELAIGYRFHDLIPETLPILNEQGETVTVVRVNNTSFDAKGFLKTGLSGVLRGMVGSTIPNFHSGMSEDYRNARISYALPGEGFGFDMAAWTIVQERERGLPTFNEYFRRYPGSVPVKIREKFEDFTTDPEYLKELKRLYKSPDDVDFSVGLQLDEEYFPGTTVPRTMLITSLFSLFGVGTADRFSVAYSASYCVLVGKPWDCTPLNPVDELLWEPIFVPFFPRARWGSVWFEEIDLAHDGDFALWNLITKNSEVKCLQLNPLWPADPKTNPVACSLPSKRSNPLWTIIWTILGLLLLYFAHSLFSRSSLGTK